MFTSKYKINRLVYYEEFSDIEEAIAREKQIKGWVRRKKIDLIESTNPTWDDLSSGDMKIESLFWCYAQLESMSF